MTQQQPVKKRTLSKSILRVCLIFSICLSLGVGGLGFKTYLDGMMESYRSYLRSILTFAISEVDGDDMARCIETLTPSVTYARTQQLLNRLKETHDIEYIYIMKPLAPTGFNNMMYVMTGVTARELEEDPHQTMLGDLSGNQYGEDVSRYYIDCMDYVSAIGYYANTTTFGYMYTGTIPVRDSNGETVALLSVDISIQTLINTMLQYTIIALTGCVGFSALFLWMLLHWMKRRVIVPVEQLEEAAHLFVAESHTDVRPDELQFQAPDISTGDEIQSLSDALGKMSDDVKTYMKHVLTQAKEKARIRSELHVATQIQADMLPSIFPPFPDQKEFEIFATMTPAKEVGGDFYDFFLVDDTHLAMVIADVSGKGVPAALFMVIAKTLIKNRTQAGGTLSEILADVNDRLCEGNKAQMFVTVWLAILDLTTGQGVAANAGHEHPVIRRADGDFELVRYRHSMALAAMEGVPFRQHTFELKPGDTLFVYTDGVPEATNDQNELYGTERMLEALNRLKAETLEDMLEGVRGDVQLFVGDAPQFDDITMLGFRYLGEGVDQQ